VLTSLGADGVGGAHDPRLIAAPAGADGWIDSLDMLLAAGGAGRPGVAPVLVDRLDLAGRPPEGGIRGRLRDHPCRAGCFPWAERVLPLCR
jgi:hypothetical protein